MLDIEEIDKYQFVDVPIMITANLIDVSNNQRKLGETSNVKVLLAFEGNASVEHRCREHHPNLLEVLSNTGIQEDGTAKIEIKIKDVSMNHDNQKFVVYLEAYRPHGENNIICAVSNPITCVRHKLVLSEAYTAPYIWYKDEGAKDKCIRILVKLIDSNKNLVKDRSVVLVPTLIYSSGLSVQPANVLNLFHDREKPFMISHNGTDVIRFRVNEVSRNHRKQLFHLLIAPDLTANPSAADISPAISLAFEVKSKRTSDAKKEQLLSRNDDDSDEEFVSSNLPTKSISSEAVLPDHLLINRGNASISSSNGQRGGNDVEASSKTPHSTSISPRGVLPDKTAGSKRPLPAYHADSHSSATVPLMEVDPHSFSTPSHYENPTSRGSHNTNNGLNAPSLLNRDSSESFKQSHAPMSKIILYYRLSSDLTVFATDHDDTIDTPLQALSHLTEWMNAAYSAMNSIRSPPPSNRSNQHNSSAEIEELMSQLIELFPIRTLSSVQFLQQFLTIHESYLLQQNQLVFQFYQQQQHLNALVAGRHDLLPTPRTLAGAYPMGLNGSVGRIGTPSAATGFPMPSPLAGFTMQGRGLGAAGAKMDVPSSARSMRGYPMSDPMANRYPRYLPYSDLKRRRVDNSAVAMMETVPVNPNIIPNSIASFESFITVIIAKYVKTPKDDKDFIHLGIPAYSTLFPPIRLVSMMTVLFYSRSYLTSIPLHRLASIRGRIRTAVAVIATSIC